MRTLLLGVALAALLPLATVPATSASAPGQSHHHARANLVVRHVSASYAARQVSFSATVRNRGDRHARHSRVATYVAPAANPDPSVDGWALGTVRLRGLKPRRSRTLAAALPVPNSVPAGDYRVLVCALAHPDGPSQLYHCGISAEIVKLPDPPLQ